MFTSRKAWTNRVNGTLPKNKFGNSKQVYKDIKYDSKLEVGYAQQLDLRLRAKDIKGWERQRLLDLKVNSKKVCGYKMDFVVDLGNNTFELVETKGFPTPEWQVKWRLLECLIDTAEFRQQNNFHPDSDLRLVLVAAQRVKDWAARVRRTRKKRTFAT